MCFLLSLAYITEGPKQRKIYLAQSPVTVNFQYNVLRSGMSYTYKLASYAPAFFFAFSADETLTGLDITVDINTNAYQRMGLVLSAPSLQLRYSNIRFFKCSSSVEAFIIYQAESVYILNSTVEFVTSSGIQIEPNTKLVPFTVITNSTGNHVITPAVTNRPYTPPCQSCIDKDAVLEDHCFGCGFGMTVEGKQCKCAYAGSELNPESGQCEHLYTDVITQTDNAYFAECHSNAQITLNYNQKLTGVKYFSVLKDDSCNIVNLYISGSMQVATPLTQVSGLVLSATKSLSKVFSSLKLTLRSNMQSVSMIAVEAAGDVTISGITLNGKLQDSTTYTNYQPFAGVIGQIDEGLNVRVEAIRILGFVMQVNYKYFCSFVVGRSLAETLNISDIIISNFANADFTTVIVTPDGQDFEDVEFLCKSSAASEELKSSLKLQQLYRQFKSDLTDATLMYYLRSSGAVIGSTAGNVNLKNIIANSIINGSTHSTSGYMNDGALVGQFNMSTVQIANCYVGGQVVAYRQVGMIAHLNKSSIVASAVCETYMDGDQWAGVIAATEYATQVKLSVAINIDVNTYCYRTGIFGNVVSSPLEVLEAIGYIHTNGNHAIYIGSATGSTTLNGKSVSGKVDNCDAGVVNKCT